MRSQRDMFTNVASTLKMRCSEVVNVHPRARSYQFISFTLSPTAHGPLALFAQRASSGFGKESRGARHAVRTYTTRTNTKR